MDLDNLIGFLALNELGKRRDVQLYLRLRNLGLKSNLKLPIKMSFLPLYYDHLIKDLDFGPVDRLIRKFRKGTVLKYLKDRNDYILLDVGCGRQATLGWNVKDVCKQYIGVDRDIPSVQVSNLRFIGGTVENILPTIPEDSVDIITALAIIEHLDSPSQFLWECLRVLKPKGLLIVTTPPPFSAPLLNCLSKIGIINGDEIKEHKNYFSIENLRKLFEHTGFEVIQEKVFLFGFNSFVVGRKS